jgi:hypothetical protein
MFCFFNKDKFENFWSNSIGDVFASITILKMGWSNGDIDLVYYPSLDKYPDHFEFDANKNLVIKKRVIEQIEEDVDGVMVVKTSFKYVNDKTIEPVFYINKGLIIKTC